MKRKLKNFLLNEDMQLSLTVKFLIMSIIFTLYIGFLVYLTIWPSIIEYVPSTVIDFIKHEIFYKLYSLFFICALIIACFCIIFTHRIAGPVYRLEKTLDNMINEDRIDLIHLRKGDELQSLADKLNFMIMFIKANHGMSFQKKQVA